MEAPMERWGLDMQVNSRIVAAVIAYLLAGFSAVLLFRRGYNWRFKFLVAVVGLMPLYEAVRLLARYHLWNTSIGSWLDQVVELVIAALFLAAVLLLDIESTDRRYTQARLRLAEAEAGWRDRVFRRRVPTWVLKPKPGPPATQKITDGIPPVPGGQAETPSGRS